MKTFIAVSATGGAGEPVLDGGQVDVVAPTVSIGLDVIRAVMIAAIDQHIADAGGVVFMGSG